MGRRDLHVVELDLPLKKELSERLSATPNGEVSERDRSAAIHAPDATTLMAVAAHSLSCDVGPTVVR